MNIEIGDRITYEVEDCGIFKEVIVTKEDIQEFNRKFKEDFKLIKIERPNYETISEKTKNKLLTNREEEFLIFLGKYYDFNEIICREEEIDLYKNDVFVCSIKFPYNMKFNSLNLTEVYDKLELRIGGLNEYR